MIGQDVNICFHGVGEPERALTPAEERYWLSADRFRFILDEIAALPPVHLSFDDGNSSDVEIVLPELLQRNLRADFFVLAGRLGQCGSLDQDAVRELHRSGMGIGSHGWSHCSWRGMDEQTRQGEFVAARARLAEVIGEPVDTAACPKGRYDRRVLADLRRLGYRRVYTSDRRHAHRSAWLQPRFSLVHDDTPSTVRSIVTEPGRLSRRVVLAGKGLAKRLR